ncbi:aldo/keto reductase [Amycolatopsis sp. NPDC006131]|uniref:aldo/keto reductase n=1 Tax=Amycolatopsis sp. NPDC006131 TaxID=3156731 RepID=UPI0033A5698B
MDPQPRRRGWTPLLIPLLESGRIRHVGVSNHNLAEIALADRILGEAGFRVEAVQNHYSLLYRGSERVGIIGHCREHDVRFFSYRRIRCRRAAPARPCATASCRSCGR